MPDMTIDEFMNRIAGIESAGASDPFTVANERTGAHGKFQILPQNWRPWAQEAGLPANAARSPENQRRVAAHKMQQYRNDFGSWEAAAVAWFAGPNRAKRFNEGDQSVLNLSDGNMTVREYVDRVRSQASTGAVSTPQVQSSLAATSQQQPQPDTGSSVRDLWTHMLQSMSNQVRSGIGEELPPEWVEPQPEEPMAPGVEGDPELPGDLGIASGGSIEVTGEAPAGDFLRTAQQFIGTPYLWGGTNPQGFDCSGLIQYAAAQVGVNLPRVSRDQARAGQEVSLGNAQAGDLIAFPARGQDVGHIGILVGQDENGQWLMLHAPRSGSTVRIDPIGSRQIATVRRIFSPDGGQVPADGTGPSRTVTPSTRPSQQGQQASGPTPQTGQPRPPALPDQSIPL